MLTRPEDPVQSGRFFLWLVIVIWLVLFVLLMYKKKTKHFQSYDLDTAKKVNKLNVKLKIS